MHGLECHIVNNTQNSTLSLFRLPGWTGICAGAPRQAIVSKVKKLPNNNIQDSTGYSTSNGATRCVQTARLLPLWQNGLLPGDVICPSIMPPTSLTPLRSISCPPSHAYLVAVPFHDPNAPFRPQQRQRPTDAHQPSPAFGYAGNAGPGPAASGVQQFHSQPQAHRRPQPHQFHQQPQQPQSQPQSFYTGGNSASSDGFYNPPPAQEVPQLKLFRLV